MANLASQPLPVMSYATLRPRFKVLQAETNNVFQNWQIRVHRALSWLKKSEELPDEQPEARFIFLWISFNCLYSRWDNGRNQPAQDKTSRDDFCSRLCKMDAELAERVLKRYRPLIKKLLEDPYLSMVFWRDPDDPANRGRATQDANYLDRNFKEGRHGQMFCQFMERLYVLRGQLVHGAATSGGKLNRKPLGQGVELLKAVVPLIIHVVMELGCHDDWPSLCYPPIGK